jgi:hypothetical protein
MRIMTQMLQPVLGICAVVYFDDISVYSKTLVEHVVHLNKVFELLREYKFYATPRNVSLPQIKLVFWVILSLQQGLKWILLRSKPSLSGLFPKL